MTDKELEKLLDDAIQNIEAEWIEYSNGSKS